MTPEEFRENVLPAILTAWDRACFCVSPGFQKLVSFNFEDYGIGPVGLADSQMVGLDIIHNRFTHCDDESPPSESRARLFECPQCHARCTETFEDYNIWMYRTFFTFVDDRPIAPTGLYLVGFYGFDRADFAKIDDFHEAESTAEFVRQIVNRG